MKMWTLLWWVPRRLLPTCPFALQLLLLLFALRVHPPITPLQGGAMPRAHQRTLGREVVQLLIHYTLHLRRHPTQEVIEALFRRPRVVDPDVPGP